MHIFQAVVNHLHVHRISCAVIASRSLCVNLGALTAVSLFVFGHSVWPGVARFLSVLSAILPKRNYSGGRKRRFVPVPKLVQTENKGVKPKTGTIGGQEN